VDAVGATEALRRRLTLRARSRSPGPSLPLLPVLTNVLHPSAQLVLDAEVLRALKRSRAAKGPRTRRSPQRRDRADARRGARLGSGRPTAPRRPRTL